MRNIRKLYFQNAAGARYGLNGEKGVYATALSGLGLTLSPDFADLNRGFFIPSSEETEPQRTLSFTMVFTQNPYQSYKAFVDWLAAAGSLTIIYNPTGAQEYCRDVFINSLEKGELNAVGWLEVPCSFFCVTPWYLPAPTALTLVVEGAYDSKRYDYEYADDLKYGSDSAATLSSTIAAAGHIPGSIELTCYGAVTNPKIRLTGNVSGKTYGICSVDVATAASDKLVLSTRYENSYVKKITADGVETDLLDALELSTTPFFHFPVNEPCTISVESDSEFSGNADLKVYYYYRSV